jgi:hypothetical protein
MRRWGDGERWERTRNKRQGTRSQETEARDTGIGRRGEGEKRGKDKGKRLKGEGKDIVSASGFRVEKLMRSY